MPNPGSRVRVPLDTQPAARTEGCGTGERGVAGPGVDRAQVIEQGAAIFMGTTPWGQLIAVALVVVGGAGLVTRLTRRSGYGWSYAALVLALASAAFGLIATIAFVWAAMLLLISIFVFVSTLRTPPAR